MITAIASFDLAIEYALYAIRDPFFVQTFIWISELASEVTVAGLAMVALIVLAYRRRWHYAAGLAMSVGGSAVTTFILKELVARQRPPHLVAAYTETSFSFPSGHATLVVALYGFLVWMLWNDLPPGWRKTTVIVLGALILLVGFSRLYLGVHYPSDVLAGYCVGAVFVWIGTKVAKRFERN